MELLVPVIIWGSIWGGLCAWLAGQKGRSGTSWFVLGFFFALIALIVLGFSPSVEEQSTGYVSMRAAAQPAPLTRLSSVDHRSPSGVEAATKKCPDCAEEVRAEARICRFCRHEFPVDIALDVASVSPASEPVATPVNDQQSFGRWRIERTSKSFLPVGSAAAFAVGTKSVSMMIGDQMRWSTWASYVEVEAVGGRLRILDGGQMVVDLVPLDRQDPAEMARNYRSRVSPQPG